MVESLSDITMSKIITFFTYLDKYHHQIWVVQQINVSRNNLLSLQNGKINLYFFLCSACKCHGQLHQNENINKLHTMSNPFRIITHIKSEPSTKLRMNIINSPFEAHDLPRLKNCRLIPAMYGIRKKEPIMTYHWQIAMLALW